jgi:hypothetical protein
MWPPDSASSTVAGAENLSVTPAQEVLSEKPEEIEFITTANDYRFDTYCQNALPGVFKDVCARVPNLNPHSIPDPNFKPRNWVKGSNDKVIGWVPIDSQTSSFSIDVGEPFEEITLTQRANVPTGLAELAPLKDALLELGDNKLSWASIATPLVAPGSRDANLVHLMRLNIEYAVRATGLANGRVTIVSQGQTVTAGTFDFVFLLHEGIDYENALFDCFTIVCGDILHRKFCVYSGNSHGSIEPRRVCRRPFRLSYAAQAGVSSLA